MILNLSKSPTSIRIFRIFLAFKQRFTPGHLLMDEKWREYSSLLLGIKKGNAFLLLLRFMGDLCSVGIRDSWAFQEAFLCLLRFLQVKDLLFLHPILVEVMDMVLNLGNLITRIVAQDPFRTS